MSEQSSDQKISKSTRNNAIVKKITSNSSSSAHSPAAESNFMESLKELIGIQIQKVLELQHIKSIEEDNGNQQQESGNASQSKNQDIVHFQQEVYKRFDEINIRLANIEEKLKHLEMKPKSFHNLHSQQLLK